MTANDHHQGAVPGVAGRAAGRLPQPGSADLRKGRVSAGDVHGRSRSTYLTRSRLQALVSDLTPRDLNIIRTIGRFSVLSAIQLEALHFNEVAEASRARRRRLVLARLVRLGLLKRLPRRIGGVRSGSSGYLYALGLAGRKILGHDRPRRPITPSWPNLHHALAISQLHVDLVEAERDGRLVVDRFVPEPDAWPLLDGEIRPDAVTTIQPASVGWKDHWAVEIDRGTERPARLRAKLLTYWREYQSGRTLADVELFPRVLLVVENEARLNQSLRVIERLPLGAEELIVPVIAGEQTIAQLAAGGPS